MKHHREKGTRVRNIYRKLFLNRLGEVKYVLGVEGGMITQGKPKSITVVLTVLSLGLKGDTPKRLACPDSHLALA